jgi:integrase
MNQNTNLLPRTKTQYSKVIDQFIHKYHTVTIENINRFLVEKNISFYKFAFFYLLKSLGMNNEYHNINKIRQLPKKRYGVYVESEKIKKIFEHINKPEYFMVAMIQFLTGCRSQDVLGLNKDHIIIKADGVTLHLVVKGMREHTVAIPFPEAKIIVEFIRNKGEYPFLRGKQKDLTQWITNNYNYYYKEIKQATKAVGIHGFRTHDFRRNFASDVYRGKKDIFLVQQLLGHQSIETTARYLQDIQREEASKKAIEEFRR